MSLQPLNSSTATTPVNTAAQAGKKQGAADAGDNKSSISSSTEGKGFIATILSPIKCAAKAIASFITAVFKKVFCCFYGRDLKADIALLEKIIKADPKDEDADKAVVKEFQALPARFQDDLVECRLNARIESKGVDLKDAKAVAEWKAVDKNVKWIAADAKEVKELFTSDKTSYSDVRRIVGELEALVGKYNADLKPVSESNSK